MATRGSAAALPPIRKSILVPLAPSRAFDLFVRRLPEWWPLQQRSVLKERAVSCHVEAELGGRLYERASDGSEHLWGKFSLFEEPVRVVFSWHPGARPPAETLATELDVRFSPEGMGTRVVLEQRGFERLGERSSFVRVLFERGWSPTLERYVSASKLALEELAQVR